MLTQILTKVVVAGFLALVQTTTPQCSSHLNIIEELKTRYNEHLVIRALKDNDFLFEVFTTKTGTTWTAILFNPNGRPDSNACIIFFGTSFGQKHMKDVPSKDVPNL